MPAGISACGRSTVWSIAVSRSVAGALDACRRVEADVSDFRSIAGDHAETSDFQIKFRPSYTVADLNRR
jgi:hypothetical protein